MATPQARIMDNNVLTDPAVTSLTFSSALTSFPGSNIQDQQRSRVWKPSGNFEVTTANQNIYINDGTNKTVALTVGFYATPVLFAAHIQTRLNASSSNWTCVWSAVTLKFTIDRTSGTKVLRFSVTANSTWDTIGYSTAVDTSAGAAANEVRVHTDEWMLITFITDPDRRPRAFMEAHALDEVLALNQNAVIKLQFNTANVWSSPAVDIDLSIVGRKFDRGLLAFIETELLANYDYGRFYFSNRTNELGPSGFSFGYFFLGDYLTFTTTNIATGFTKQKTDPSNVTQTDSGAEFFKKRLKFRELNSLEIQNALATERRPFEDFYDEVGLSGYFFLCIDPTSAVTEDLDEATAYGRFNADAQLPSVIRDIYTIQFDFREVI